MSLGSIGSGPSLGLFTMGILLPWVNAKVFHKITIIYYFMQII